MLGLFLAQKLSKNSLARDRDALGAAVGVRALPVPHAALNGAPKALPIVYCLLASRAEAAVAALACCSWCLPYMVINVLSGPPLTFLLVNVGFHGLVGNGWHDNLPINAAIASDTSALVVALARLNHNIINSTHRPTMLLYVPHVVRTAKTTLQSLDELSVLFIIVSLISILIINKVMLRLFSRCIQIFIRH